MTASRTRTHDGWRHAALAGSAVAVAVVIGMLSGQSFTLALPAALLVLVVGVAVAEPRAIPVLAVPATLAMSRVGGVLSVADVVLIAATGVALFLVAGRLTAPVRALLWAGAVYLALTVPTLILNPYAANAVEWAHEVFLVLGSILVGYAVGRTGGARVALTLYVAAASVIGVAAAVVAVVGFARSGVFEPAYLPEGLHKNFIGGALAASAVIAFARPPWMRWPGWFVHSAFLLGAVGILAAQSRQGLVALVAGMLVVSLRPGSRAVGRGMLTWWLLPPAAVVVAVVTIDQFRSLNRHNSFFQRLDWFAESTQIWLESPVFGVGMRWWYTDRFDERFQPPNVIFEVLTTTGVVGLLGFVAMFVIACAVLLRLDPRYGTVALAVIVVRLTQTQLDLYWLAGASSLLWIMAGLVVGVRDRDAASAQSFEHPAQSLLHLDGHRLPHSAR